MLFEKIILPSVITKVEDFDFIENYDARPNYITKKIIQGPVCLLDKDCIKKGKSIRGKIVVIENADPGFDWIFTKGPSGLITKFGGLASHMAIRCAEFGLPAAIGCGENLFNKIINAQLLMLDCQKKKIEFLN